MSQIIDSLEQIAKAAHKNSVSEAQAAIKKTRALLQGIKNDELEKLDHELDTWQTKLEVIFREPVGRSGMAKHAEYWVEKLRSS